MQEKEESGLRAEVERLTSELAEATTEKEAALVSSTESAGSRSRPTSSSATARPVSSENNRASADKARSQRESIDKKLADLISSGDGIQPDGARELIAELQALLEASLRMADEKLNQEIGQRAELQMQVHTNAVIGQKESATAGSSLEVATAVDGCHGA